VSLAALMIAIAALVTSRTPLNSCAGLCVSGTNGTNGTNGVNGTDGRNGTNGTGGTGVYYESPSLGGGVPINESFTTVNALILTLGGTYLVEFTGSFDEFSMSNINFFGTIRLTANGITMQAGEALRNYGSQVAFGNFQDFQAFAIQAVCPSCAAGTLIEAQWIAQGVPDGSFMPALTMEPNALTAVQLNPL
jgi:hypothetical protein